MFRELENFKNYILECVNPSRIEGGLDPISDSDIESVFYSIEEFCRRWESPKEAE